MILLVDVPLLWALAKWWQIVSTLVCSKGGIVEMELQGPWRAMRWAMRWAMLQAIRFVEGTKSGPRITKIM